MLIARLILHRTMRKPLLAIRPGHRGVNGRECLVTPGLAWFGYSNVWYRLLWNNMLCYGQHDMVWQYGIRLEYYRLLRNDCYGGGDCFEWPPGLLLCLWWLSILIFLLWPTLQIHSCILLKGELRLQVGVVVAPDGSLQPMQPIHSLLLGSAHLIGRCCITL